MADLRNARLYLVCDERPQPFLEAVLASGVDIVQLRMKDAADEQILAVALRYRDLCSNHGAVFILNDRPDLAVQVDADGVHVGQEDVPVAEARKIVGPDRVVGLSTHTPEQIDAVHGVDYIGVGPVYETPTKPGRRAVGLELVRYAAVHATVPFFAIGGIDQSNVAIVRAAGATRIAVVRALTEADDPRATAKALRQALTTRTRVGAT